MEWKVQISFFSPTMGKFTNKENLNENLSFQNLKDSDPFYL